MTVIAGVAVDALGLASHVEAVATGPGDPLAFRTRRTFSALPADEVADEQPAFIRLDVNHDERPIGSIRYLERCGGGSIWAVARVFDASIDPTGMSFSVAVHRNASGNGWAPRDPWRLDAISLTKKPAMTSVGVVEVIDASDVDAIDDRFLLCARTRDAYLSALLQRAKDSARTRRRDAPLLVHDIDPRRADRRAEMHEQLHLRHGPVWLSGHAGRVIAVR